MYIILKNILILILFKGRHYSSGIPTNINNCIRRESRRIKIMLFVGNRQKLKQIFLIGLELRSLAPRGLLTNASDNSAMTTHIIQWC